MHIHAPPGTTLSKSYGEPNEAIWQRFVGALEQSDVQDFGKTDNLSFDGYMNTVQRYRKAYRLQQSASSAARTYR